MAGTVKTHSFTFCLLLSFMQPNYVDFLHRFKPVNTSAEKPPVGQPKKKLVDQPLATDCTHLTIARAIAISDLVCLSY